VLDKVRSKIILEISVLIFIQIALIIGSFGILIYFESQGASIGNSINIAGKNRFLTATLLLQIEKYLEGSSNVSQLYNSMENLQKNIMTLKQGGSTSGVSLGPLPPEFSSLASRIDSDWNILKKSIMEYIIDERQDAQLSVPSLTQADIEAEGKNFESLSSNLVRSSDALVTNLGLYANVNSRNLILLQTTFGVLNIVILILILYVVARILRPISALTRATSEIEKGNLDVSVKQKGKDELSILANSFNSMVYSLLRYKERQKELTSTLASKNEELTEIERDLRRANEDLMNTEEAKEEFLAMISHELKTPLTPLKMYSEMLLKVRSMGTLNEKQLKVMKVIYNNISQLELLINDIFDVYKLDIGRLKLNIMRVQVASLVKESISGLELLMRNKGIHFNIDLIPPSGTMTVLCDPRRIRQVITNLIKNSVDFVPDKGGRITIRTNVDYVTDNESGKTNYVTFTIEDNGSGIPPEKIDNLFKKFYQIDTSVKRKHGGTGLGLVICKGIIESHGGKIWIAKTYTSGTCIRFTLPIADEDDVTDGT
jgi:signal transduction histidine kinase